MDPNHPLSKLDPKLKETYDRVMNIPVTPPAQPTQASSQPPPTVPISPTPSQTVSQQPQGPTIIAGQTTVARREPERIHIGSVPKVAAQKKPTSISPVLYILGGIIFLIVYAVFWLKFFNVPVPFLP